MCKSSIQAEKEMKIKLNFVPALSFLQDPDSGSRQKFHIQLDPDSKHWCKCYLTLKPAMELGRLFWHVQRNPERCFRGYRYLTSVLFLHDLFGCLNSSQWGLFQGIWGVDSRMELVRKLFVKACWYYMIYLYIYTYATDSHVKTVISRDFSCCLPNICFSQHSSSILTENLRCVRKNVKAETCTIKLYK